MYLTASHALKKTCGQCESNFGKKHPNPTDLQKMHLAALFSAISEKCITLFFTIIKYALSYFTDEITKKSTGSCIYQNVSQILVLTEFFSNSLEIVEFIFHKFSFTNLTRNK